MQQIPHTARIAIEFDCAETTRTAFEVCASKLPSVSLVMANANTLITPRDRIATVLELFAEHKLPAPRLLAVYRVADRLVQDRRHTRKRPPVNDEDARRALLASQRALLKALEDKAYLLKPLD